MANTPATNAGGFNTAAAVTRSLLGWGVVAGVFYLVVGVTLGLTRGGFDFSEHALSLLMLGDHGWMQRANIVLSGVMVLAAAVGFVRAMPTATGGSLVGTYGACLIASGIFAPDPMNGFPAGASEEASVSGLLHLAFGAIGFLALAVASFLVANWFASRGDRTAARSSRIAGVVVAAGFVAGGALAAQTAGVVLLWIAVIAAWAWLAGASVATYRTVPHPNCRPGE